MSRRLTTKWNCVLCGKEIKTAGSLMWTVIYDPKLKSDKPVHFQCHRNKVRQTRKLNKLSNIGETEGKQGK